MMIGGAEIASHAFTAGVVDDCHLFVRPILVGGGKHSPATLAHIWSSWPPTR
ncbi:MAG: dihydrofolate reductase family protein [Acidimicrobiia bacterium]